MPAPAATPPQVSATVPVPRPQGAADDDAVADSDGPLLLAYLADRDVPCPRCGYNLRRLAASRCPECGDALALRVGSVDPRLGPYVALLLAWAWGLGGSLFFGTVSVIYAPRGWWARPGGTLLVAQLALTATGLTGSLLGRRRVRRASARAQRLLAIAAWGAVLLSCALVVVFFGD